MDFGTLIFTKPQRAIIDPQRAEARGFTHAWFPDSHMIWGDAYVCMALAAANTKTIKLATGISVAANRIPPVTVHSLAVPGVRFTSVCSAGCPEWKGRELGGLIGGIRWRWRAVR